MWSAHLNGGSWVPSLCSGSVGALGNPEPPVPTQPAQSWVQLARKDLELLAVGALMSHRVRKLDPG